jgi:hypothetical protein
MGFYDGVAMEGRKDGDGDGDGSSSHTLGS